MLTLSNRAQSVVAAIVARYGLNPPAAVKAEMRVNAAIKRRRSGGITAIASVLAQFNGSPATSGLLMFAGTTYQLSAKDNLGNVLTGAGTWSSSDGTNAPVNSSTGLVSPAAGIGAGNLTYTHTATGYTSTVPFNVFPAVTAVKQDAGSNYANTAALAANVSTNVTGLPGTGSPATALYTDGAGSANISVDSTPSRLFMGGNTFFHNFPPSQATDFYPGCLRADLKADFTRLWQITVERYCPAGELTTGGATIQNFTVEGNIVANPGANAAFKKNGFAFDAGVSPNPNGRCQVGYNNGDNNGHSYYDQYMVVNSDNQSEGSVAGGEADYTTNNGKWLVRLTLAELRGPNEWAIRHYIAPIGTIPVLVGTANCAMTSGAAYKLNVSSPFVENYGRGTSSTQQFGSQTALWKAVSAPTGDPFGLEGTQPTPTLTSLNVSSLTQGQTAQSLVLTGTNLNRNCVPVLPSGVTLTNSGTGNSKIVLGGSTTLTLTVDVSGSASTGATTIAIKNLVSNVTTSTQAFTINSAVAMPTSPVFDIIAGKGQTLSGSNVTDIVDQVSGTAHLATGATSPTYGATDFNGHPGITFASAASLVAASAYAQLQTTSFSMVWMGTVTGANTTDRTPVKLANSGAGWQYNMSVGPFWNLYLNSSNQGLSTHVAASGPVLNTPYCVVMSYDHTAGVTRIVVNNSLVKTDTLANALDATTTALLTLGNSFVGVMGRTTIYNRALSTSDETAAYNYAHSTYGV